MRKIEKAILVIIVVIGIAFAGYAYYQQQINKEIKSSLSILEQTINKIGEPISTNIDYLESVNSDAEQLAEDVASATSSLNNSLESYKNIAKEINDNSELIISNAAEVTTNLSLLNSEIENQITNVSSVGSLTNEVQTSFLDLNSQVDAISTNLGKLEKQSDELSGNLFTDMENLGSQVTSISSDLQSASNSFETAASNVYDDLESHSSKLETINTEITEKTGELIEYIDTLMVQKTVDEMLSIIANGDWPISTKDAMYMRIIAQDPTNKTVFNQYIDFLNEIEAEEVYYYDLHSLLSSVLYSLDIEEIPVLLDEIDCVNSILEEKVQNGNNLLTESWNSLYYAFEKQAENFDGETFAEICDSLNDYYGLLSTTTTEIDLQFSFSQYIYSFYKSYAEYVSYADRLLESDYGTLNPLYVSANNVWITVMTQFLSRDKSDDGVFSRVLETMLEEIKKKGSSVNLHFENLLCQEIRKELVSAERKIQNDDLNLSLFEKTGTLQSKIATLSTIASTPESFNLLDRYAQYAERYQRALYVAYQEWAANILSKSEVAVDEAKTENDLKALFDAGYFSIDSNLLIPQLKTWYDSLCTSSMIEKSTIPLEKLVGEIHPKGLNDMENLQ